ncbi:MAG: hypothetical protein ACRDJM_03350, partial [Actinomycetota bacterium]
MPETPILPPRLPDAPPPVPPPSAEPPPGRDDGPARDLIGRSPPRSSSAFAVLVMLLAVSLTASTVLAVRLADVAADAAGQRARADELRNEVERLRSSPPPASQSPGAVGEGPIADLAAAVARLRGLAFKTPVAPEVLTPAELRRRIEADFIKEQSRAEIDRTDRVLTTLGLLAPGDDLFDILRGVHTEQVAGYYDSDRKKLVVSGTAGNLTPYDRVLTAHELVHALTDQHFSLSKLDSLQQERKDDEATAYQALIEGDATLMMLLYRDRVLTPREQQQLEAQASEETSPLLDAAPAVVRKALLFPYDRGALFASSLFQRGGTAAIDRAYRQPPTSTEQILHPQKFLQRDDPEAVSLPNVAAALGSSWRELDEGGAGELDIQLIADQFLPEDDARAAAEGWDGGRYRALWSGSKTIVVTSTVWDTADEAREAADFLTEWLRPRFGGNGAAYRSGAAAGWESPQGTAEVARSGQSVVFIVGSD